MRPVCICALLLFDTTALLASACKSAATHEGTASMHSSAPSESSTLQAASTTAATQATGLEGSSVPAPSASNAKAPSASDSASSPQPSAEEWASAPQAANATEERFCPKDCKVTLVREWVNVQCGAKYFEANWQGPQARRGEDYFTTANAQGAGIIFRSKRGEIERVSMTQLGVESYLRVVWPTGALAATIYFEQNPTGVTELFARRDPQPIPDVPTRPAPREADADWLVASEVNTTSAERAFKGCSLRMIDDWVKLFCVPGQDPKYPPMIESLVGFGTAKTDFFWLSWSLKASWIEFRVQRGKTQDALLRVSSGMGALHVEWPESSPKPTVISVEAP